MSAVYAVIRMTGAQQTRMRRYLVGLALLALLPMASTAQRHGRADSVQNYMKSSRPLNPQLALNLEAEYKWIYFHLTDLRQMKRTAISVTNSTTNVTISYEGISLGELVPDARAKYAFEIFKESWGFRDMRVISSASLNLESEVIVADTINGIPLGGENPFCFVAKTKPVVLLAVDQEDKLRAVLPIIVPMVKEGMINLVDTEVLSMGTPRPAIEKEQSQVKLQTS
jgi:hypothetical protein